MTYEEAGYIIGNIPVSTDNKSYSIEDYQEAKTLAVAALWDKSESVTQDTNNESKVNSMTTNEAIEVIKVAQAEAEWEYPMDYAAAFDMAIEALKKETMCNEILNEIHGYWIDDYKCSVCGGWIENANREILLAYYDVDKLYPYCPHCGARMMKGK